MEKKSNNSKAEQTTIKASGHRGAVSARRKPVHAHPKSPAKKISKKRVSSSRGMSKQQERLMGGHRVRKPSKPKAPTFKEPKPIEPGVVRVIPLGGVEEVGRNMLLIEYGDDIVVFDVGFHFIDEEETMGADYTLPNIAYLEKNKKKIKAVVITHGHLDHIGGIPFIMERIGNPPIYAQNLTTLMIKKRQEEYPGKPELDIHVVDADSKIELSEISLRFFPVFHSIPDSMGIILETPQGNVIVTGDMKIAHKDGIPTPQEVKTWGDIGKENNLLFIADSTNAEMPGFSISEVEVQKNIEKIIQTTEGRLIIGTFASQFERLVKIIEMCERYNKKVVPEGRSIKTNIEIAKLAGFLKPKEGTLISVQEMADYPPDRIVVIATGAQGEEFAALMRIATNQHKFIKLSSRDTILLSSSVIPGNEINIQKLKDNLYRHDPTIIHYRTSEVHSGGHGRQEDLLWINKTVRPKFFIPGYGGHSMLRVHAQVVHERNGFPKENIVVPDNGMVIEVVEKGTKIVVQKERAPANVMVVDGLSVGGVQEVVIRDRQMLAQDGIFVVIAMVDTRTGEVRKSPDIISRGFVYLREAQDMLQQSRYITKKSIESQTKGMHPINFEFVKKKVADDLGRFLFQQTAKRPIVLPVLLGV